MSSNCIYYPFAFLFTASQFKGEVYDTHSETFRHGEVRSQHLQPQQSNVVKHSRLNATQDKSTQVIQGLRAILFHCSTQKYGL